MKIAIPLAQEKLCAHFGHCEKFALLEVDEQKCSIVSRTDVLPPPHEPGVLPQWLAEKEVKVIISGGMGQRAQQLFASKNIQVIVGAPTDTPEALAIEYVKGNLKAGANLCDH